MKDTPTPPFLEDAMRDVVTAIEATARSTIRFAGDICVAATERNSDARGQSSSLKEATEELDRRTSREEPIARTLARATESWRSEESRLGSELHRARESLRSAAGEAGASSRSVRTIQVRLEDLSGTLVTAIDRSAGAEEAIHARIADGRESIDEGAAIAHAILETLRELG